MSNSEIKKSIKKSSAKKIAPQAQISGDIAQNCTIEDFRKIMQAAGDVGYIWNINSNHVEWIGDFADLLGSGDAENKNEKKIYAFDDLNKRMNPQDLPNRMTAVHNLKSSHAGLDCEYRLRDDEGNNIWIQEKATLHHCKERNDSIVYGMLRQITEKNETLALYEKLALRDHITGFKNRTAFLRQMHERITQGQTHYCVLIGVDRLNFFEEAYGGNITNELLLKIGRLLQSQMYDDMALSRIGEDCFGLIMTGYTKEAVQKFIRNIVDLFSNTSLKTSEGYLRVTLSIGAALCEIGENGEVDALAPEATVNQAEQALKQARSRGFFNLVFYQLTDEQRSTYRNWIATGDAFVRSIENNKVALAFQPVMNGESNKPHFYECLIRMLDETGKPVPAGLFIPAVEKMGLSGVADIYAATLAINELEQFPDINLSVNVSGDTVSNEEWLRTVVDRLSNRPDIANRLIVEITETTAVRDLDVAIAFISILRQVGCRVALDDFGAGYTSFSQLDRLNIDMVKIDGSFIQGMQQRQENQLFVKALHMLASGFGLETVVEGVETEDQLDFLRKDGLRYLQGYVFGKPSMHRLWLPETHELYDPNAADAPQAKVVRL